MFERFTEQARRTMFFARYETSELGGLSIEGEHLLLGLVREGKGLIAHLFGRFAVSLQEIRREVEAPTPRREKVATSIEIPFAEEVTRMLRHAKDESDRLGHGYIGSEHILLGILREERSVAAQILLEKGMQLDAVREELQRSMAGGPPPESEPDLVTVLLEENARLRSVIEYLLQQQDLGRTLQLREDAYWLQGGEGAAEGPYCAVCWNIDRRLVRKEKGADGALSCEYCTWSR